MAIDINGTTLQKTSGTFEAAIGATKLFQYSNQGALNKSSVNASWIVGNSTDTWVSFTTAAWTELLTWSTTYRITPSAGSFTNSGRYYAPVRGAYLFSLSMYVNSVSTGGYVHPAFWINGNSVRGTPANDHSHRIRGHGNAGGYPYDLNFSEIKFMEAGDYVSVYYYTPNTASYWGTYGCFAGYLLG